MNTKHPVAGALFAASLGCGTAGTQAAEIHVMSTVAFKAAYLEMLPAVPSAEEIKFWYFSKSWLAAAGVTTNRIAAWASDSDTSLIEEDTIMKGAIWRYKKAKGLDYAEEFREYELSFVRNLGQEGTGRVVQTASMFNWPPDFWPGMITAPTP